MKFEKPHRREPTEPQLATMIDVFSILIIFLIAGSAMDSSILNIPADLILPETSSSSTSLNAPQVTLKNGVIEMNFINERISIKELDDPNLNDSNNFRKIKIKIQSYIDGTKSKKNLTETQLLQSINLVADKETSYKEVFATMKVFRNFGFQNTILVGLETNVKK